MEEIKKKRENGEKREERVLEEIKEGAKKLREKFERDEKIKTKKKNKRRRN